MDMIDKIFLPIICILVITLIYALGCIIINNPTDKACQELGYTAYLKGTCEDAEGNQHYVKMSCPFFSPLFGLK